MQNFEVTEEGDGVKLPDVDREEFELPSYAFGAKVTRDKDGNPTKVTLPKERVLKFAKPGKNVGFKRLFTVKAMKPDGTVIQIPLERQINNNVASPEDAIGLRKYTKRGYKAFYDFEHNQALFCGTWDCWAAADPKHGNFCCAAHKDITQPEENAGAFGLGATTASLWKS